MSSNPEYNAKNCTNEPNDKGCYLPEHGDSISPHSRFNDISRQAFQKWNVVEENEMKFQ